MIFDTRAEAHDAVARREEMLAVSHYRDAQKHREEAAMWRALEAEAKGDAT